MFFGSSLALGSSFWVKYHNFSKERTLELRLIFWATKLFPKIRTLHVTLFAWCGALPDAFRNALFMALTLFSWKNSENRGKSPNFCDLTAIFEGKIGLSRFLSKKFLVFRKKKGGCSQKLIIYFFPRRASFTLFAWETRKERILRSFRVTLFATLFWEVKVVPKNVLVLPKSLKKSQPT